MEKRVFDQDKTQELTDYDLSLGRLQEDKLVLAHHDAVEGKTAAEVAAELSAQGKTVERVADVWYEVIGTYPNGGKDLRAIQSVAAREAWDEYEEIFIYIPYSEEELITRRQDKLRVRRAAECFPIVNRGVLWYEKLTTEQKKELSVWYEAWLDAPQTGSAPDPLDWVK